MQKQRQSYTLEYKRKAVALGITHCSITKAARELGISVENIRRWKKQLDDVRLANRTKQYTESTLLQLKKVEERAWRSQDGEGHLEESPQHSL